MGTRSRSFWRKRASVPIMPVKIGKGEQFQPDFLNIAEQSHAGHCRPRAALWRRAVSVFESGAILLYLAEKTGRFLPPRRAARSGCWNGCSGRWVALARWRGRTTTSQYAPEKLPYAIDRYVKETNRLYGVLDRQLADHQFVAGAYSIADMAGYPWIVPYERQGQNSRIFPTSSAGSKAWRGPPWLGPMRRRRSATKA